VVGQHGLAGRLLQARVEAELFALRGREAPTADPEVLPEFPPGCLHEAVPPLRLLHRRLELGGVQRARAVLVGLHEGESRRVQRRVRHLDKVADLRRPRFLRPDVALTVRRREIHPRHLPIALAKHQVGPGPPAGDLGHDAVPARRPGVELRQGIADQ